MKLFDDHPLEVAQRYPTMRYMGSKYRLLPWIYEHLQHLEFDSVLDGFSGSGSVSYLFKGMGKTVFSNDFLHFSHILTKAVIENQSVRLTAADRDILSAENPNRGDFIQKTFEGIFVTVEDLAFLDNISFNIRQLSDPFKRSLALSALIRACLKRQPRGVFTIAGDLSHYDDGRRDLKLSLKEHFPEQVEVFNHLVFNNHRNNKSFNMDIFDFEVEKYQPDLVYLDPPYVPRSDDNCYVKRYHFLEGLSKYWEDEEILLDTKVRKIKKKYTPFSYRSTAVEGFEQLFYKFRKSKLALSYSSNGYPDLDQLIALMQKHKSRVEVVRKEHRYHFGNHASVERAEVDEYLIIGE